jgi:hypothetical protein
VLQALIKAKPAEAIDAEHYERTETHQGGILVRRLYG